MGVAASSSSSSSSSKKYEVFLSFRGEDTRRSFTSHLHTALCLRGIETFIDYGLPKGDDISQSLIQAIQDSSLSVVIFSENYASSKWCLNELVEILRCKQNQGQLILPIFYQVDPSHVRNQRGAYEKAFTEHLKKIPAMVNQWKQALLETASLAGWDSRNCRDEAELIQNIVNDIIKKLNRGPSSVLRNIVGIDENCDDIELLLEEFSTIGIWGIGGIGKTTMTKVVFAKFRSQFDICCYLEILREESKKHGVKYIRDKLFSELLKDTSLERLGQKKILIVLDDVTNTSQLDYLENEAPCLGPGSKVIITSRDKHVLNGRVQKIHKAKALGYNNSLKLFNLKAFCGDAYNSEYQDLVERALAYAQGSPLALTTLGSFLHSKTIDEWESALRKLERIANHKIQAVLKLSFDELDDEEKNIFLDIACFLKGKSREYIITMLEGCGFRASIGLRSLMDKALITIEDMYGHCVEMHDLIQSMAFEIVRQECIKNPGRRSRLWNPDEIYDVLKNNQGTDAIEGISLNLDQMRDLQLNADAFRKMTNLRFLKFYSTWYSKSCPVNLPSGLESFSESLRYLRWDNFPSGSLSLSPFCAEKLVELYMPNSRLERLWDGVQDLVNLRMINLKGSGKLIELPDFSMAKNLQEVDLSKCRSLCEVHPSILTLPRLRKVKLVSCKNLKSLKAETHSKSVTDLNVGFCSSLKEFSFSSDKITTLRLAQGGVHVETLDFSIGCMEELQWLDLNCSALKNLSINDICCMRSLKLLHLYECGGIIDESKLHTLFDALLSLQNIMLDGASKLIELPNNIKHLSRLQFLGVGDCKSLQSLPELPPSIQILDARHCTSLKTLQLTSHIESSLLAEEIMMDSKLCSSVSYLKNLRWLDLDQCEQLDELPESIGSLSSLTKLNLSGSNVEGLPASIKHLSNLDSMYLINCRRLRSLPELPYIQNVFFIDCISLESHSLSRVIAYAYFSLKQLVYKKYVGCVCYPGRNAPKWFRSNQVTKASNCITIELPSATNNVIGFILCSVLSHSYVGYELQCNYYLGERKKGVSGFPLRSISFDSHNVILWCVPCTFKELCTYLTIDWKKTDYRPKLPFEFSVENSDGKAVEGVIEACGVCPVYASEYLNFIQQMELKSNVETQKETCHDAKISFNGILEYASFSLKQGKCGNSEGSIIPEWFTYKSSTKKHGDSKVSLRLALNFNNLIGFIFCFVIPHFSSKESDQCHASCYLSLDGICNLMCQTAWHYSMIKLNSNDVFMWYDPLYCESILQAIQRTKKDHDVLKFIFEFGHGLINDDQEFEIVDCLIKECGVRPIYVSEYTNFIQQNKLEVSTRKRPQSIDDDQHQLPSTKKLKESSIIQSIPPISESKTPHDVDELPLMLSRLTLESTKNDTTHQN